MFLGDDAQSRKSPGSNKDHQDQDQKPDHLGHRKRLRERFLRSGPDGPLDYELIKLMLFAALPRRDTKPRSKTCCAALAPSPKWCPSHPTNSKR
jgi:hypothetical protein